MTVGECRPFEGMTILLGRSAREEILECSDVDVACAKRIDTIAYHTVCLPISWLVFQNDDFFPNNKFSVWPHVMSNVSLGTAKLNDSDPLSIG